MPTQYPLVHFFQADPKIPIFGKEKFKVVITTVPPATSTTIEATAFLVVVVFLTNTLR